MSLTPRAWRAPDAIKGADAGCAPRVTKDGGRRSRRRRRPAGHPPAGAAMTAEHRRLETLAGELTPAQRCYPGLTLTGASYHGLDIAACVRSGERTATSCRPVAGPERRAAA